MYTKGTILRLCLSFLNSTTDVTAGCGRWDTVGFLPRIKDLGVDAQLEVVRAEVCRRGWNLVGTLADRAVSGATPPDQRPQLGPALKRLDAGRVDVLVVQRLDRITRSLADWALLVERSQKRGWAIVAVAEGIDLASPAGEMVAGMLAAVAQFERRLISSRTREAMAAAKARGRRLGRPVQQSPVARTMAVEMRQQGATLAQIADALTDARIPTALGGRWWRSTVRSLLESQRLDEQAEAARRTMGGVRRAAVEVGLSAVVPCLGLGEDHVDTGSDHQPC